MKTNYKFNWSCMILAFTLIAAPCIGQISKPAKPKPPPIVPRAAVLTFQSNIELPKESG